MTCWTSPRAAPKTPSPLAADGHLLTDDDGRSHVTDPFLADWLRVAHPL